MDAVAPPRYLGCGDVRPGPQLRRRRRRLRLRPPPLRRPRDRRDRRRGRRRPAAARRRRRDRAALRPAARAGLRRRRRRAAGRHARDPRARTSAPSARWPAAPRRCRSPTPSVDGAVCSDAWHWFDGARAADELARVVRPGGGVVVCVTYPRWYGSDDAPDWWLDLVVVHTALPKGDHPALVSGWRRPDVLRGPSGLRGDARRARSRSCTTPTARGSSRTGHRCRSWRRCPTVSAPTFLGRARRDARPARRRRGRHPLPGRAVDHSAPASASAASQIRGSGELTSIGAPVTGCAKASRAACRNWRSRPSRPGVPYSGSPTTG